MYYHLQHGNFVLLQYKRMSKEGENWLYRPDGQFDRQHARMTALDEECESQPMAQYRLAAAPCFFKMCQVDSLAVDSLSPVGGMYVANKQAAMHLRSRAALGERNGTSFSFENVSGYMTTTLFTDLVAHGLIGTSGASSDLVYRVLEQSLEQRGAAVLGVLDDRRGKRPGWREAVQVDT